MLKSRGVVPIKNIEENKRQKKCYPDYTVSHGIAPAERKKN